MKKKITSMFTIEALLGLLLATSPPKIMAADQCKTDQIQPVVAENGSALSGRGALVVSNREADVIVRAENLTPGVAYMAWFVYFNDTAQCLTPNQCGPPDLTMPSSNPEGVFGRMDSAVASANGQLTFKGALRDFQVSAGSAVHIALFAHGPASTTDNQERARQLLTPENPALGAPGLGLGTEKGFLVGAVMFDIAACK